MARSDEPSKDLRVSEGVEGIFVEFLELWAEKKSWVTSGDQIICNNKQIGQTKKVNESNRF